MGDPELDVAAYGRVTMGSDETLVDDGAAGFEALLVELSTRFINTTADRLDDEIEGALRQTCEWAGFDVAVLWQWEAETPGTFTLTHHYRLLDGPPLSRRLQASESFPWGLREVLAGRSFLIASMDDVPLGAERDRDMLLHFGVKNILLVALSEGCGPSFGAISFHDMTTARHWPEPLVKRLGLVAQLFANAILRARADRALKESAERLALAAEAAGAGPWILDASNQVFWLGDSVMGLLGLPSADRLEVERFMDRVHPEDRQSVRDAIATSLRSREMSVVEYRFVRPDGAVRWMQSRGRLYGAAESARLMGITTDITPKKVHEQDLRESGARMAAALDVAELGFYEVLNGVRVTFADRRAGEILGWSEADEKAGRILAFWAEHLHPEDLPRVMSVRQAMEEAGTDRLTVDYRFMHPERGVLHIHHLAHVMERDVAGRAVRTIGVLQDITGRMKIENDLRNALAEVSRLRDHLNNENIYLREQMRREAGHGNIIGESEGILKMLAVARKVAAAETAVLITGETGTGKELLAQAIHDMSARKTKPMIKVNCAALPAPLIESELFGRERGAYTGAMTQQVGRFEIANGSTIFLDEIGDLPLDLQVKLLRVLQDGRYERLGSHRTLQTNVRVIAATNRDLAAMMRAGSFREDLFHRLNVFAIETPPLRSRVGDIPLLAWTFIQEFNVKMGRVIDTVPKVTMERLKRYAWPGNVRELRNVIERSMIISEGRFLEVHLPESPSLQASTLCTLEDMERKHIGDMLERTHWRIRGKGGAAELLGMNPTTLHSRLKKLGITRPER